MGEQGVSTLNEENRWYVRLMKLAHDLAMDGCGQEAQDLREAATHIRNYPAASTTCPLPRSSGCGRGGKTRQNYCRDNRSRAHNEG